MEHDALLESLVSIATEAHRFEESLLSVLPKLGYDDRKACEARIEQFSRRVRRALEHADMKSVVYDGQRYDPDMPVTPLNIKDFARGDALYVSKTEEPTVVRGLTVVKRGTVQLAKAGK